MCISQYYVYVLVDPRDQSPFYVGKGKGNRAYTHTKIVKNNKFSCNIFKDRVIRKILDLGLEPLVVIYEDRLDEEQAYDLEEHIIHQLGRRCTNDGPLTNLVESARLPTFIGQDPWNKGIKGIKLHSDEYKERLRQELTGKSWVDRFGADKAAELSNSASQRLKGKTLVERLGPEKAAKQKEAISKKLSGRSLEDIIGKEAADNRIAELKTSNRLTDYRFKPGHIPSTKGISKWTPLEKRAQQRENLRKWRANQKSKQPPKEILSPTDVLRNKLEG